MKGLVCFRTFSTAIGNAGKVDVVVSGGGMVGAALAAAVANSKVLEGRKTVVMEAAEDRKNDQFDLNRPYSNRVSAINTQSRRFFDDIGAWRHVRQSGRAAVVRGMNVWEGDDAHFSIKADNHDDGLFHIVENDLLVWALNRAAEDGRGDVEVWNGASLETAEVDGCNVKATLKGGKAVDARLLVGADGANSAVRRIMPDCRHVGWSYDQFGVVATLHFAREVDNRFAWQKFIPGGGPIALLPLAPDKSSLVWTLPAEKAKMALKMKSEELAGALMAAVGRIPRGIGEQFPQVTAATGIAGFPLGLGHASRYCSDGLVLVGDAAHRVHPLAGQGVNLGFGDVECLVRALEQSVLDGAPLGSLPYLQAYETERQRENVPMMAAIDFLQKATTVEGIADFGPWVAAKQVGFRVVNSSSTLKKVFANFAGS